MNQQIIKQGKTTAIVSYLTLIGTIIAIFMNLEPKNTYARFHTRQAFGVFVTFYILGFLVGIFDTWLISTPFYIFFFVLWAFGFINAIQGVSRPIPLLGKYFQNWFKFIQ